MAAPVWKWDPTAEASGAELVLTAPPYRLLEQSFPMPDLDTAFASSVDATRDTLTGLRYRNRKITLKVRADGSASDSALESALADLTMKAAKTNRDAIVTGTGRGGTLSYTSPTGDTVTFDVVSAQVTPDTGQRYVKRAITEITLEFECLPFGRGAETTPGDHVETTLPALVLTESSVPGDVPALGRLVVDNDEASAGANQAWLIWGIRSKTYSSDADCALFYQAEGRTCLGGSAAPASTGYAGVASGSGSNVVDVDGLATSWEAVLSTQASGGGSHLQHVGSYRVFARVQADALNAGVVGVCLEWAPGDFRNPARNSAVYLTDDRSSTGAPVEDAWLLADLGIVSVPQVQVGTQFWEGRILAKSTDYSDQVFIDYLMLVPIDEGSGVAQASPIGLSAPGAYTAFDDFSSGTYSGPLAGDTLPAGGTWGTTASPYETDDFSVSGGYAVRTAVSDGSGAKRGRIMYPSGTSAMTDTVAVLRYVPQSTVSGVQRSIAARIVDKDNLLLLQAVESDSIVVVGASLISAGVETQLGGAVANRNFGAISTLTATVTAAGEWTITHENGAGEVVSTSGYRPELQTGGIFAAGSCGIHDYTSSASAVTRQYDSFAAWAPVTDAAVFALRSVEVRHDGVLRQDSAGGFYQRVRCDGDYLIVPASGKEARPVEVIVKACRVDPYSGADNNIDDLSAKLYVTPRYLQLPA